MIDRNIDKIVEVVKSPRRKNIGFWVGILGLFLAVTKIEIGANDTWVNLLSSIEEFFMHPARVFGALAALAGIFNNPTEKGVKDSDSVIKEFNRVEYNKRIDLEAREKIAENKEK